MRYKPVRDVLDGATAQTRQASETQQVGRENGAENTDEMSRSPSGGVKLPCTPSPGPSACRLDSAQALVV